MLERMSKPVVRRPPQNDKPTLGVEAETWSDVDELFQLYELDKKLIAKRLFEWFMASGADIQEPILRSHQRSTTPEFARLILERMASGSPSAPLALSNMNADGKRQTRKKKAAKKKPRQ